MNKQSLDKKEVHPMQMKEISGLILAGGRSRRMGRDKAKLLLDGKSLLQWQVEKLQQLGLGEILISAPETVSYPGIRTVQDCYSGCGPISGLHAGLSAASCRYCLVIGVDLPLIPESVLRDLCSAHECGVTILSHAGGEEPLLGVYDSALAPVMEEMIRQKVYKVREIKRWIPVHRWHYTGPKEVLCNCNCPSDLERARRYLAAGKEGAYL